MAAEEIDSDSSRLRLAVALDGAGWHPGAWRSPEARPHELFTADYWVDLVGEAARGLLDFVYFPDSFLTPAGPQEPDRTDRVRARLDSVQIAARVAPVVPNIGLVPSIVVTHTEPFHVAKAIATLDFVSQGRAGVALRISDQPAEDALFGRRRLADDGIAARLGEAADYVEVMRRLWDSWEDDAEIRDVDTGRFIDYRKLHYIDFEGAYFRVKGPSITPRPPQGQPVVLGEVPSGEASAKFAAALDIAVMPEPASELELARLTMTGVGLRFADLAVWLDDDHARAADRRAELAELAQFDAPSPTGQRAFVGTAAELADHLERWHRLGIDGFRLWPAVLPTDLEMITRRLVPELQRRGLFRTTPPVPTLRGRLGWSRPASRYTGAVAGR